MFHYFFRVLAAFLAEREREAAERLAAALRAWRDNAFLETALLPSRLSALKVARERFTEGFFLAAFFLSLHHAWLVLAFALTPGPSPAEEARRPHGVLSIDLSRSLVWLSARRVCPRECVRSLLEQTLRPGCWAIFLRVYLLRPVLVCLFQAW